MLSSNIRVQYRGGGTAADADRQVPEHEGAYPEPSMFGTTPAYGLFVRHARNVTIRDVDVSTTSRDRRPPVVLDDVDVFYGDHVSASRDAAAPFFRLLNVRGFAVRGVPGMPGTSRAIVKRDDLPAAGR